MPPLSHELFALLVMAPLVVVLHEAGHALMAAPAGFRVTSFGLGAGAPLIWRMGRRGGVFHVGRWFFMGGTCVAIPARSHNRPALYHLGGPLAQLMLALALAPLLEVHWVLSHLFSFNLLVLVWNLIPWRLGGYASDGWWLLTRSRRGERLAVLLGQRRQLERVARFEEQARAPLGAWYARLCGCWLDVLVGRPDQADPLLGLPIPRFFPQTDTYLVGIFYFVKSEWHRAHGRLDAALGVWDLLRQRQGGRLGPQQALLFALCQARCRLAMGDPQRARLSLARVVGAEGPVGRDAVAVFLAVVLAEGDGEEVEAAALRLARLSEGAFLDPVEAVTALWAASQGLDPVTRTQQLKEIERAARRLAAALLEMADPEDRTSLVLRLGPAAGLRVTGREVR